MNETAAKVRTKGSSFLSPDNLMHRFPCQQPSLTHPRVRTEVALWRQDISILHLFTLYCTRDLHIIALQSSAKQAPKKPLQTKQHYSFSLEPSFLLFKSNIRHVQKSTTKKYGLENKYSTCTSLNISEVHKLNWLPQNWTKKVQKNQVKGRYKLKKQKN